jgi:phage shock protein PspC (stress-responsive transcriptional regulator)
MCGAPRRIIVAAMTETLIDSPLPPPAPDSRRLVRDPDDKVVAGVCAGFGRYTQTDPVLWRVAIAVLALLGGAGLALYALGWLLVPRRGEPQSIAERTLRRPDSSITVLGVVLAVVVGVVLLGLLDGAGVGAIVVLGILAYLVARDRRDGPPPAQQPLDQPFDQPSTQRFTEPLPPPAPRERSALGGLTLSAAAVLTGGLLLAREYGIEQLTGARILALALLVVGAGLLVGTWYGRARWLLPIGVLLALAMGGAAAAERVKLGDGVGERSWRAVDAGTYSLGAGEATLDLRGLRGAEDATVSARVGLGQLTVLVPRGLGVAVVADVDLGQISTPDFETEESDDLHEEFVVGPSDDVTVTLDLEVRVGQVEVRYV